MINFFKNKTNKIQLFPFIFNSIEGKPFHFEIYDINGKEKKIEFFFLKQSKYNSYFLDMKQYVIWSIVDNVYRVFVDEDYYQKFKILYQKEINIIYMNFLSTLLNKRLNIINKNFVFSFLNIFVSLFFIFVLFSLNKEFAQKNKFLIFFITFISNFIFLFFYINIKQRKIFQDYKKQLLKKTMQEVKFFLGAKVFEEISKKQRLYFIESSI